MKSTVVDESLSSNQHQFCSRENQLATDSTTFGFQVLVILGTPTSDRIINVIKESEIDELSPSLKGLRIAHLLACHLAELSFKSDAITPPTVDPTNLSEVVKKTKRGEIDTFLSKIIHGQIKTLLLGSNMHVIDSDIEWR